MALPGAIQDVARRLPAAAARLAGVPGSGGPLDAAEAEQVAEMLATLEASLGEGDRRAIDGTADALLSDDSLRIPMLHLVAFAVRISHSDPPAYLAIANRVVFTCNFLLSDREVPSLRRAKALVAFACKLLRMDTLKCCACQCSSGAAQLAELAGAGWGEEAGLLPAARTVSYPALARDLLILATRTDVAERLAHAQRQMEEWQQLQQQFAGELAAALRDSHVLEHAARWALHMQLAESAGRLPQGAAVDPLTIVVESLMNAVLLLAAIRMLQAQGGAPAHPLGEALSGPCLRHALLSLGVAALCAADGGPSHGLPPGLLLRLPLLGPDYKSVARGAPGKQPLIGDVFIGMMQLLERSDTAAAAAGPARDGRSVAALLHRIGRFMVSSARAWAEEGAAVAGAEPEPELTQLLLDEVDIMPVAAWVLVMLRKLSSAAQAALPTDAAALAEAEAARWRLAVEVATHCLRWVAPAYLEKLAKFLGLTWRPPTPQRRLAPVAPRVVAAALAGGLLPLWERLLRCAARVPGCAEHTLLSHIMTSSDVDEPLWLLLAYGDQRQGAALVATLGKLLRTLVVPQMQCSLGPAGALEPAGSSRAALACELAGCVLKLLGAAVRRLEAAGLADLGGSEASAPQLQLVRLASLAACEWLPPLARLARGWMLAESRGAPAREAFKSVSEASLDLVLAWLRVLSQRCCPRLAVAVAAAEEDLGPEPAAAAAAAAAAGWRQLLLREVGAVEVLGTACQHTLGNAGASGHVLLDALGGVLNGCCVLAAACPGEARRAVLEAAAEAEAAPGGSGGPEGLDGSGFDGRRRRAVLGGEARPGRATTAGPLPGWSPQLFRAMEAELRVCSGGQALGLVAGALARQAEKWAAGGVEDAAELVSLQWRLDPAAYALRASSPAHARALLRTCSNPACDNLAGESEAGLQLRTCGRCGSAWYCRRECLALHWRSGHKEACVGRGEVVAAATARPGQSAA